MVLLATRELTGALLLLATGLKARLCGRNRWAGHGKVILLVVGLFFNTARISVSI